MAAVGGAQEHLNDRDIDRACMDALLANGTAHDVRTGYVESPIGLNCSGCWVVVIPCAVATNPK